MSVTTPSGGRNVRQKKCRLRDPEAIEERSRAFYQKFCEGTEVPALSKIFGYTESYIYRLFKRLPARVRVEIRRDVARQRQMRLEDARELIYAGGME
jgi:transposase